MYNTTQALVRIEVGRSPVLSAQKPTSADDLLAPATGLIAYPNPATEHTTVNFSLSTPGKYSLDLYDIRGAKIMTLAAGLAAANKAIALEVNVAGYAKGVYLLKLLTVKGVSTQRLLIQR